MRIEELDVNVYINLNFTYDNSNSLVRGEVFTPISLVNEMLDLVPNDMWSKKDTKWLDLCAGRGNFGLMIYLRLMKGLEKVIKSETKRHKHIFKNMLYFIEIDESNVKKIKDFIGNDESNVICGDGLTYDFGFEFDVVVSNPPYNLPNRRKLGGATLWSKFVRRGLDITKKDGYMVMVHPHMWRNAYSTTGRGFHRDTFDLLAHQNTMLKLVTKYSLYKTKNKIFKNAHVTFDFYIVQKCKNTVETIVITEKGEQKIDLNKWTWLPSKNINIIEKLLGDSDNLRIKTGLTNRRNSKLIKEKTDEYKYPTVYSTGKRGVRIEWSDKKDKSNELKKVIWGAGGSYSALYDKNGEYNTNYTSFYIEVKNDEEGEKIQKIMTSDFFINEIMLAGNFHTFEIDIGFYRKLKDEFWNDPVFCVI